MKVTEIQHVAPKHDHHQPPVKTGAITLVEQTEDYQEPLILAVYGLHGCGKSRLGATGPGDIAAAPLDRKAKQTIIATAKENEKRLFLPNIDLVRSPNPLQCATLPSFCQKKQDGDMNSVGMSVITKTMDILKPQPLCCAIHHYRWHVNRVKHVLQQISEMPNVRTVIIDSFTNLWDDILFANHGRTDRINPMDRAPDNREVQEILGICTGKNMVLTLKEKEIWKNNKPTGEVEWAGYSHLGYEVGAILHLTRDAKSGEFRADFEMVQACASLIGDAGHHTETGLINDMISFPSIATMIYPDSEWTDWE